MKKIILRAMVDVGPKYSPRFFIETYILYPGHECLENNSLDDRKKIIRVLDVQEEYVDEIILSLDIKEEVAITRIK